MANIKEKTEFTPGKVMMIAVALLLFSAAVSIIITGSVGNNRAAYYIRNVFVPDGKVQTGTLDVDGIESIKDVPEGEVRFFLNKEVTFANGYSLGDVLLQNPEACGYILEFRYYLAEGNTNKPVFTSPKIKPGEYLEADKLDSYLVAGEYDCTYTVTAYDVDNPSEESGITSGFLTLTVEN